MSRTQLPELPELPELVVSAEAAQAAAVFLAMPNPTREDANELIHYTTPTHDLAEESGWAQEWADTGHDPHYRGQSGCRLPSYYFPEGRDGGLQVEPMRMFCAFVLAWYFERPWDESDLLALAVAARLEKV